MPRRWRLLFEVPPRRVQPQHRDRCPPAARRAAIGGLRAQPVGAGAGQGGGLDDEVRVDRGHGRDAPTRSPVASPIWRASGSTSSPSGSTCARRRITCRSLAGSSRPSSTSGSSVGEALGIGHVEASPLTRSSYHARQAADAVTDRRHRVVVVRLSQNDAMSSAPSTATYLDRINRARRACNEADIDVLLVSVGRDLPYLTGYEAMPLERLTMLVVPKDGDATLVVPRMEAPRVVPSGQRCSRCCRGTRPRIRLPWSPALVGRPARRRSVTRCGHGSWSICWRTGRSSTTRYVRSTEVMNALRMRKDARRDRRARRGRRCRRRDRRRSAGRPDSVGRSHRGRGQRRPRRADHR